MKNPQNSIESKYIDKVDLDHLNFMLNDWQSRQDIIPDFGFDVHTYKQKKNWDKISDYIKNHYKYERLENYVMAKIQDK